MPTILFKSTDPGMPANSGTAGALLAVLDAVLVNGGTTQSITSIIRSGSVATATKTAHGFRNGALVAHGGADQAEYNVEATVTVVDANTYTFPVSGTPATPATGTITAKMAAAGWTKPFSGTNKGVYRAPLGNRFYLRVLDDGSDATNAAKVAKARGFETMSDVDTGTGPFPTDAQLSGGVWCSKSSTADAVSRPWAVLVDGKRIIFLSAYLAALTDAYSHWGFGDLVGTSAADLYPSIIYGASSSGNAMTAAVGDGAGMGNMALQASLAAGLYAARNYAGDAGAVNSIVAFPCASTSGSGSGSFSAGPDSAGNVWADPIQISRGNATTDAPRGIFPGVLFLRNSLAFASYPSFYSFGAKMVIRYGSSHAKAYLIDTAAWE